MNVMMSYVLLILALLSILMMLNITEEHMRKRDMTVHVVLLSSILVILYNIVI